MPDPIERVWSVGRDALQRSVLVRQTRTHSAGEVFEIIIQPAHQLEEQQRVHGLTRDNLAEIGRIMEQSRG